MRINESFYAQRNSSLPKRLRRNQGDYIRCFQQRECSSILVPIDDHGHSRSFGSRSQQLVDDSEYPGTFNPDHSMTVIRPINARPSMISVRDYMEEDVHPDQPLSRSEFLHRGEYPVDPSYISYHPDEEMALDQQSLRSHIPGRSRYDSPSYACLEEVVPNQPISRSSYPERRGRYSDTLGPDQPISRSGYPGKRRRYSDNPSYDRAGRDVAPYTRSNLHGRRRSSENSRSYSRYRRDSTKYGDPYEEARHPRNYKKRHNEYHAKRWEGTKERAFHGRDRLPYMRSRITTSNRSFKKTRTNSAKFGGMSNSPSYDSKGSASASGSYSAKVLETKSSKGNEEVDSTNKLAANLSKDNAESNLTKKPETMQFNDNAETDLSKKLATKSSRDDAEANLTKKLETKSSKDNAGTNLAKKLATVTSNDDAEANATKPSKDDAEANATKKLATKPSKNVAQVNVTKRPATKPSKNVAQGNATKELATNPPLGNAEAKLTKELVTKLSEDNTEANLTKELGTKLSEDNAEANLTKELGTKLSEDNTEANFTKELGTKLSEDNTEANFTKELGTKLSEDNAEANLKKELGTKLSEDNAEANLKKELGTKLSEDNAEAILTNELGTKFSQDNVEANLTRKLEPKPSKSDQKEVKLETQDNGSEMMELKANFSAKKDASSCHIKLKKDGKFICYAKCTNSLIQQSSSWNVDIVKKKTVEGLLDLPTFSLFPSFLPVPEKNVTDQKSEWNRFLTFLYDNDKVATVKLENLKIHVFPSAREPNETDDGLYFSQAVVAYDLQELCDTSVDQGHATSVMCGATTKAVSSLPSSNPLSLSNSPHPSMKHVAFESDAYVKGSSSPEKATCSSISKCHEHNSLQLCSTKEDVAAERNFVTNPSYLKTLGHAHSGWIFGAIAELVDNSRDARASRLEIAVETIYDKTAGSEIPMLSVIDDGVGMNHQEILRMISFGHKVPDEDNQDCIGRFGVGFKTGSMRLGRDALVLTQTTHSRSVAFLSQSLNEGKDNVEIPVVSYCRQAQCMDIDTSVHSEALAKNNLNAIKQFSPFNEYLIGEKAGLFRGNTGTQIYIWNLDKWGAEYTLEWQAGLCGGSTFHQGDIYIRSRRVRKRPGQTSRKVSLDYSLRSYLEVIFLEPRMKIYVQGSLVRSRPLAKSLNNTAHHNGDIMGKQVRLTLGRCQIEWDEANCGIFLYWHGRLIEAYKRVGGMVHSADMGRGVIGVIDVTELMDDGNGDVWVHNNKQGFQDCEPYALLEEWLGKQADEYWDKFFDPVQLKKGHARYKPDNNWVQCDKCRKWRLLDADFDSMNLPKDWFCYMEPFNGKCEMPEEKPGRGVITVGLKRSSGHDPSKTADCQGLQIDSASPTAEAVGEDKSTQSAEGDEKTPVKKARRGKGQDKSNPPAEDDEEIPVIKRRRRSVQNARKYIQE